MTFKETSPKGFSASKCDVGYWIFSKSWEFFGNFFWKFLGILWELFGYWGKAVGRKQNFQSLEVRVQAHCT